MSISLLIMEVVSNPVQSRSPASIYLGTFLISFTSLALEVTITRLLSVITFYHLAFFAVSVAMLGMTVGAVTVYLKPHWFTGDKLDHSIAKACLGFAIFTPLSLYFLTRLPVGLEVNVRDILNLVQLTIACLLPFCFSGIAITAVLTKHKLPIGRLYASDLAGASLGCLFVLGAMQIISAPSLIIITGFIAAVATVSFAWPIFHFGLRYVTGFVSGLVLVLAVINIITPFGLEPLFVKGHYDDPQSHLVDRWNSFSRVVVYQMEKRPPAYWGPGPDAPQPIVSQYRADIDAGAGTWITQFTTSESIDYLRYDVTNMVHYICPGGSVCIIGSGGGRDVQSAIIFGHPEVTGVDVNPIFIDLLESDFRDFAGVAGKPGVKLVADEARSFITGSPEKYSVIQMSMVDTWAATAAGALTLSENSLYTVEAWRVFYDHLDDNGFFTASRHYIPDTLDETGRAVSMAAAMLLQEGITDLSKYIAVIAQSTVSTLLVSKQPFNETEIAGLRDTSARLGFDPIVLPDEIPKNKILAGIVSSHSIDELDRAVATSPLNFQPTTDENPYFFNMLRLNHMEVLNWSDQGVLAGNISATFTLGILILVLIIISSIVTLVPLILRPRIYKQDFQDKSIEAPLGNLMQSVNVKTGDRGVRKKRGLDSNENRNTRNKESAEVLWAGALYFTLIGAGFMFVEMGLIQRLSVFLGHPVYGLGVLLFTIIAAAGAGSFFSDRLPLTRTPWIFVYPILVAALVISIRFVMPVLGSSLAAASVILKIIISIVVIAPLGLLMGVCFPAGMRLVRQAQGVETPWYWALNGMASVLCSALASFISIYISISFSLYIGAICYMALLVCLPVLRRMSVTRMEALNRKSNSSPGVSTPNYEAPSG